MRTSPQDYAETDERRTSKCLLVHAISASCRLGARPRSALIKLQDRGDLHMAQAPRKPTPRLTEIEFCAWVAQAEPGDRLEYHRGFLAADMVSPLTGLSDEERDQLRDLGDRAFWAAEAGLVHLVQQRIATDCFAYLAIARPKSKAAAVSLSALLLKEAA